MGVVLWKREREGREEGCGEDLLVQAEVTKDPVRISSALPPRLIAETKNGAGAVETVRLRRIDSNHALFFT